VRLRVIPFGWGRGRGRTRHYWSSPRRSARWPGRERHASLQPTGRLLRRPAMPDKVPW